jgi:hypothetical protein
METKGKKERERPKHLAREGRKRENKSVCRVRYQDTHGKHFGGKNAGRREGKIPKI